MPSAPRRHAVILGVAALLSAVSFAAAVVAQPPAESAAEAARVRVATTTSLYDTGLWDVLEAAFEAPSGRELDVIYAGTGKALQWGAAGDVDAVVTHSPGQEAEFVAAGHGRDRTPFAYNYFLIVGPAADPAALRGLAAEAALRRLHDQARSAFVSRGDDSGTHAREKAIWKAAGLDHARVRDAGPWYVEAGLGMGPTLQMAAQLGAYTLTDNGTFLAYEGDLDLAPIVTEGAQLLNVYSVILCTKAASPAGAAELAAFLTGEAGQRLIGEFGREAYGAGLFTPCAGGECGAAAP